MSLIEAFYSQFGDIDIKINKYNDKYTVSCWCDTEKVCYAKDKEINKAMLKAFNKLADMQGEADESIFEYKAIFKKAYEENNAR